VHNIPIILVTELNSNGARHVVACIEALVPLSVAQSALPCAKHRNSAHEYQQTDIDPRFV
jgi:hypothetical protein